jgi:ankyrin repeat protein
MNDTPTVVELPPLKISEQRFKLRQPQLSSSSSSSTQKYVLSNSTALHQSILDGRMNSLNYFLKMGFNPNTKDKFGRTCLMLACLSDHEAYGLQVAKLLFKYGAEINDQDSLGRTVVAISVSENREALFEYFMDKHTTNIDFRLKDNDGNSLINYVACHGSSKMIRRVVDIMKEKGIEMDQRNNGGYTALLLAVQNDRFLNAFILLKYGQCSTTIKDNEKRLNAIEWLLNRIESNKDILLNNHDKTSSNNNHASNNIEGATGSFFVKII